ncbi:UDP binding domain-containing protein [Streptomyces sp. NPDC001709]
MRPGLGFGFGFGGGCLPKDLRGFITRADELDAGQAVGILREADAVNTRRRQRVVDLAREELGPDLRGKRITVRGAAFKPETDDIRDSPALAVAQALHDFGATVTVTDPKALDNARKLHPQLDYIEDSIAAVQDADLLLHLTEWPQFTRIDPKRLVHRTARSSTPAAPSTQTSGATPAGSAEHSDAPDHRRLSRGRDRPQGPVPSGRPPTDPPHP